MSANIRCRGGLRGVALFGFLLSLAMNVAAVRLWAGEIEFTTGQLLVATPEMVDPRFAESVIYMVRHDRDGAMGLVINRPMARGPIKDLLKGFGIESEEAKGEIIIHYGGPVGSDTGYVLHSDDVMLDDSRRVKNSIAVSGNAKLIEEIARGNGPRLSLVVLGYAGWAPGQLEGELAAGAWHVVPADNELVFGEKADEKWRKAMDRRQIPL
jgi:putative transcriptional regulator